MRYLGYINIIMVVLLDGVVEIKLVFDYNFLKGVFGSREWILNFWF